MTRNRMLLAVAVVIVIGVVAYAVTGGPGPSANKPADRYADSSRPVVAPRGDLPATEPPAADQPRNPGSAPTAVPAVPNQLADAKSPKPEAPAIDQNKPNKPGQRPGARVPGLGGNTANGYRRSGMRLAFLMMGIGGLEESGKEPLTAAQAKKIIALVEPLRTQKTLDAAQAEEAAKKVNDLLTDKQKQAMMSAFSGRFRRPGGPGGQPGERRPNRPDGEARRPGPGGPEGQRPPGPPNGGAGQRPPVGPDGARPPAFNMSSNPLDPNSESPFAPRLKAVIDKLKAKAK